MVNFNNNIKKGELNLKLKNYTLLLFLISTLILPLINFSAVSYNYDQSQDLDILLIYSNDNEKIHLQNTIMSDLEGYQLIATHFDNLTITQINEADTIIIAGSDEHSLENDLELKLIDFTQHEENQLIAITPDFAEFGDELETIFGIENLNDILPETGYNVTWTVELTSDLLNHTTAQQFDSISRFGIYDLVDDVDILANVIASNSTDEDFSDIYPFPAIWNMTSSPGEVLNFATDLVQIEDNESDMFESRGAFHPDQLPLPFDELILDLLVTSITSHQIPLAQSSDPNSTSTDDRPDETQIPLPNPQNIIIIIILGLFSLIFLFFQKFKDFLGWIMRKIYYVGFLVVGAFYNVQDRVLDYNEVMMNQSRTDILDYLDHVGPYGAHMRDIKSAMNMGSGSLLWHLQVLEDFRLIEKKKISSYTVFVSSEYLDVFDPVFKEIELSLQSKYLHDIASTLVNYGEGSVVKLGIIEEKTKINRRTLRRIIKKMEQKNLLGINKSSGYEIIIQSQQYLEQLVDSIERRSNFSLDTNGVNIERIDE